MIGFSVWPPTMRQLSASTTKELCWISLYKEDSTQTWVYFGFARYADFSQHGSFYCEIMQNVPNTRFTSSGFKT